MNPLTRSEVESWPALGPMNLDKQRVLDLFDRIAEFERLQQVWLMSPEAAQSLQGYRDLAEKCAGFEAELAELRALNTQLAAQVDEARRQREDASARLRELREVAERNVADAQHLRQSAILLTIERDEARRQRDECAAALATIGHQMEAQQILDASEPTPLEAAVTAHTEHVAVTVERLEPDDCGEPAARYVLRAASVGEQMYVTTDEAVALITALLADGAVHSAWLHGRGGR